MFLLGIPVVFNVSIISTHGYFENRNVIGIPNANGKKNIFFIIAMSIPLYPLLIVDFILNISSDFFFCLTMKLKIVGIFRALIYLRL